MGEQDNVYCQCCAWTIRLLWAILWNDYDIFLTHQMIGIFFYKNHDKKWSKQELEQK